MITLKHQASIEAVSKFNLEIIAFNAESCLIAEKNGATRIELCASPAEGGTTPNFGLLKWCSENIKIPVFPMIRPRGGDFLYSTSEFEIILNDIKICKQLGFSGIVTGCLNEDGSLPLAQLEEIIETAYPMSVTFHRAFDRCNDMFKALEQLNNFGFERVLTSGGYPNAELGKDILKQLVAEAPDNFKILIGSGIRSNNILDLAKYIGTNEFHSSATTKKTSQMQFINSNLSENLEYTNCNGKEVADMKNILSEYFSEHSNFENKNQ